MRFKGMNPTEYGPIRGDSQTAKQRQEILDVTGLGFRLAISRSISEPLADDATNRTLRPLNIINSKRDPIVVPKIKFGEITMQMFLADVLIDAIDPALEDREVSLGGVSVSITSDVFILRVNDGMMAGEFLASFPIDATFVSAKMRSFVDPSLENWSQVGGIHFRHMVRANAALAFDKRDNRFLGGRGLVSAVPSFAANEGFIYLNKHALTSKRTELTDVLHRFADAMSNEPASFEINAEHTTELICAEAFLAAAHQVHSLQPDVQGDMAFLEDGPDLDGERLPAGIAFVDPDPGALASQQPALIEYATVRAYPTVRPNDRLDISVGGFFVAEPGLVENWLWHRLSPCQGIYNA
jgi:hypothetical protein